MLKNLKYRSITIMSFFCDKSDGDWKETEKEKKEMREREEDDKGLE